MATPIYVVDFKGYVGLSYYGEIIIFFQLPEKTFEKKVISKNKKLPKHGHNTTIAMWILENNEYHSFSIKLLFYLTP